MLIIWGEKTTERPLGYVADFCPICRAVGQFRLLRVGIVSHLYYISLGSGRLAGHKAVCQTCDFAKESDPTHYRELLKRPADTLDELERTTFPQLREVYAERLEIEETLRTGRADLPAEVRAELIREPFENFAGIVEARFTNSSQFDKTSALVALATVLGTAALLAVGWVVPDGSAFQGTLYKSAGFLLLAGFFATLFAVGTSASRYLKKRVLPRLAKSLRPLRPEVEELDECLRQLRSMRYKLARKVRSKRLVELIEHPDQRVEEALEPRETIGAR